VTRSVKIVPSLPSSISLDRESKAVSRLPAVDTRSIRCLCDLLVAPLVTPLQSKMTSMASNDSRAVSGKNRYMKGIKEKLRHAKIRYVLEESASQSEKSYGLTHLQPMLVVLIGVIITTMKVNIQLLMTERATPRLLVRKLVISAG
jgi:hypothetical protein